MLGRCLPLVAVLTVSCTTVGAPGHPLTVNAGLLPGPRGASCSVSSDTHSKLTLVNASAAPVDMWWVDFKCDERFYSRVLPNGGQFVSDSFVGHAWRVRAAGSEQLLMDVAGAANATPRTLTYAGAQIPPAVP